MSYTLLRVVVEARPMRLDMITLALSICGAIAVAGLASMNHGFGLRPWHYLGMTAAVAALYASVVLGFVK